MSALTESQVEPSPDKAKKHVHSLSIAEAEDFNAKLDRRGIVYLARIPPRMGPSKVKTLLGSFGTVTRCYLVEEDKTMRKRRMKQGSTGGKRYLEGWVEFEDKAVAKKVGMALNNTPITNHKRSVHFGDHWSIKYVSKFKWAHLTEKVAYERRMREQKLRLEMTKARKENQAFAELVEAGKVMDKIEQRRKKRTLQGADRSNQDDASRRRTFQQTTPLIQHNDGSSKSIILSSLIAK